MNAKILLRHTVAINTVRAVSKKYLELAKHLKKEL